MLKYIINFYRVSMPRPCNGESLSEQKKRLKRLQWSTFFGCNLWVWNVLCLSAQFECNEETDCR